METKQLSLPLPTEPNRVMLNFPLYQTDAELEAIRVEAAKKFLPRYRRALTSFERHFGYSPRFRG